MKMMLLFSMMGLYACTQIQFHSQAWPDDLPSRQYFTQLYLTDESNRSLQTEEQYLTWGVRFYEGWELYPTGWKTIETDVLDEIIKKRFPIILDKLRYLGKLISGDWAKDNSVRRITTAMLSLWGEVIYSTIELEKSEQALDLIMADVLDLLTGALTQEMIQPGRYETRLEISLERVF